MKKAFFYTSVFGMAFSAVLLSSSFALAAPQAKSKGIIAKCVAAAEKASPKRTPEFVKTFILVGLTADDAAHKEEHAKALKAAEESIFLTGTPEADREDKALEIGHRMVRRHKQLIQEVEKKHKNASPEEKAEHLVEILEDPAHHEKNKELKLKEIAKKQDALIAKAKTDLATKKKFSDDEVMRLVREGVIYDEKTGKFSKVTHPQHELWTDIGPENVDAFEYGMLVVNACRTQNDSAGFIKHLEEEEDSASEHDHEEKTEALSDKSEHQQKEDESKHEADDHHKPSGKKHKTTSHHDDEHEHDQDDEHEHDQDDEHEPDEGDEHKPSTKKAKAAKTHKASKE